MKTMNLIEILQSLQDFRARLDDWGVTSQGLWIAGGIAVVFFFFSLREVLSWYLRMQQVRDEVRKLRADIGVLQRSLDETKSLILEQSELKAESTVEKKRVKKSALKSGTGADATATDATGSRFRFDH